MSGSTRGRREGSGPLAGGWSLLAFTWGLAEATLFFVVPDVLLTVVGVWRPRHLLRCCLWATAGATLGGAVVLLWASRGPQSATHLMLALPAISPELIDRVFSQLKSNGCWAPLLGAFTGVPYKLYALKAQAAGLSLAGFLAFATPVARLSRFLLVGFLVREAARRLLPRWSV
ncbi:MAG TPA: hypothetical protein VGE98_16800 [Thermoanaerobaculia bacterium]